MPSCPTVVLNPALDFGVRVHFRLKSLNVPGKLPMVNVFLAAAVPCLRRKVLEVHISVLRHSRSKLPCRDPSTWGGMGRRTCWKGRNVFGESTYLLEPMSTEMYMCSASCSEPMPLNVYTSKVLALAFSLDRCPLHSLPVPSALCFLFALCLFVCRVM